ncbi:precorrin-2 C(20)-methyltransferase [Flammeovirga kamogawensis]|uniref:Precorrin-2 C(20)-methyltransferase n=1 Tax=Flammeovirga kamogawensis TaxID=373891 RepID=A0ABX8H482_9BACT|nr:precorrin-2 C(20)-methyltransferase [Flammeovirga kamogawensis]MBB6460338.1 precorrin-2/cobalt-factor-2 C20-methyltransferase [Flammeovirga kamogawensis]QWG10147.1 precorrin-2 C(20)-methyltransferase [Flammeovirga kamogawensis]TRX65655.1 precorrin-2 C(20)-methyltransferase [Flammeovirga kamogawensis]
MEKGKIYGISLGPGDPDLITVKGLKTLQTVDKIYYPGSLQKNGAQRSYSLQILENYNLDQTKLNGFYLNMTIDRSYVDEVYEATFQQIKKDYENCLTVAIVSEGDLSTYSSFSYLLEKIHKAELAVELVPGITSFHLGAAITQQPLALLNETVKVLPMLKSREDLEEALKSSNTVILMKIKSAIKYILPLLSEKNIVFTYCEKLGTDTQFITSSLDQLSDREIPYFSLLIIKQTNYS